MATVLRRLCISQLILLLLLGICRVAFYFAHGDAADRTVERADWWQAALLGARFDLVVLAYVGGPAVLVLAIMLARGKPGGPARWLAFARHWFFWSFLTLALISLVDFSFYATFQDRLNVMVFGFFEDHTLAVLSMIWDLYPIPLVILTTLGFVMGLRWMLRRVFAPQSAPADWHARPWARWFAAAAVLFLTLAAARGSLGKFPLRARMASVSPSSFLNLSVLNGPFALKEALAARLAEGSADPLAQRLGFAKAGPAFAEWLGCADAEGFSLENALAALAARTPEPLNPDGPRPHVVLMLMESLGVHLVPHHSPAFPVLDRFGERWPEGWSWRRGLPEANSTVGTVSVMGSGLPNRPNTTYLPQSRLAQISFRTAPAAQFHAAGYETIFVYGGNTTWRKFDQFLPRQGFDRVEGLPAIHAALGLGEEGQAFWKTYDENLFAYLHQILRDAKRPVFLVVLTATNHPPFEWLERFGLPTLTPPPELAGVLASSAPTGRLKGIQYSCRELGRWMDRLETDGLLDRTLLAVTGDHNTLDYASYHDGEKLDRWGVPLWLRVPEAWKPALSPDFDAPAGHLDLVATLMHLALPDRSWICLGSSLLDPKRDARVMNESGLALSPEGAIQENTFGLRAFAWEGAQARGLRTVPPSPNSEALRVWTRARLAGVDHLIRMQQENRP